MGLPFLYEVFAESLWRAMGWVCDEGPNAVINTLKQVFQMEKHEMVAVHASIRNEKRPVQPHGTNWLLSGSVRKTGRVKENINHLKTKNSLPSRLTV